MKRNIGFAIMALCQMLSFIGIDLHIQQADVDAMGTAVGGIIAAVGVLHDMVRRYGPAIKAGFFKK